MYVFAYYLLAKPSTRLWSSPYFLLHIARHDYVGVADGTNVGDTCGQVRKKGRGQSKGSFRGSGLFAHCETRTRIFTWRIWIAMHQRRRSYFQMPMHSLIKELNNENLTASTSIYQHAIKQTLRNPACLTAIQQSHSHSTPKV